jgi:sugar/nucleoside kinase (ribokinase family)
MEKYDVLVVGELNVDLILDGLHQFPETGKEIIAPEMTLTLGSSSAILASNLSVLGNTVRFLGKIGKDAFGKKVMEDLQAKGVNTDSVIQSNTADTGITVALNYSEQRAMVTYPGAMEELSVEEITDQVLASARHLHVSSVFLQPRLKPGLPALFRRAKEQGLTTSLDPQWDPSERWDCDWSDLLPYVDLFMPNLQEAMHIAERNTPNECISALKPYANTLVIKNGEEGALIWDEGQLLVQKSFHNPSVVDAIGAGDSFNAGYIHRYIRQENAANCAAFGALCGAVNTTAQGGTGAFSSLEAFRETASKHFNYQIDDL